VVALSAGRLVTVSAQLGSDFFVCAGSASITTDSDADSPPAVDLLGGTGSFAYSSITCPGYSDGDLLTPLEAGLFGTSGSGTYANTVCGTGQASGAGTITSSTESGTLTFNINFTSMVGRISGAMTLQGPDDAFPITEPIDPSTSVVVIVPKQVSGNDVADCSSGFFFAGTIELAETPQS
jgi:hypothetical protein